MNIDTELQDYEAAGSLAEELPYWGWLDDERSCLTRAGELMSLARISPFVLDGQTPEQLDRVVDRWQRMLSGLDARTRFYFYLLRRPVRFPEVPPNGASKVVTLGQRKRREFLTKRVQDVSAYVAWAYDPGLSTVASERAGPWWMAGAKNWMARRRNAQRSIYLHSSIEAASAAFRQTVDASRALVDDLTPLRLLKAHEASEVLSELTNRPGTPWDGATGSGMNWRLAVSELEAERRNLRLDGEPVVLYSLLSPPGSARSNLLADLYRLDATLTVTLEWRPQRLDSARRKIRGAQRHYFSKRYSMSAHVQETEGSAAAMVDTAAAAESDRLGDALVELETEGVAYGDLALTIAIHGPLEHSESLDGDIRRIFASHDAKAIREGYGQLPAWFSRLPGQPRRRQVRSVFVSAGVAACMAPIFGPPVGTPQSGHLRKAAALAILETGWRTPYHYDLFQGDVGHTLVLGATGAGKSFLLNFLLVQALQYDPRVLILDLGGSYRWLTQFLGGGYMELSPAAADGEGFQLRPFSLPAGERTYQFLTGWISRLLRIGGWNLSGSDPSEIRARVEDLYAFAPGERTLGTLVHSLPSKMWPALGRWHGDGAWGKYFDNPADGEDLQFQDWQVIDMAGAAEHDDLCEAALFYLLERLRLALENPDETARVKLMVVDEAWRYLQDPAVLSYLAEAAKTWRKKNAALIVATQSAVDVTGTAGAEVLLESMPTKLFLANPDLPEKAAETFRLNPSEMNTIRGLIPKRELYLRRTDAAGSYALKSIRPAIGFTHLRRLTRPSGPQPSKNTAWNRPLNTYRNGGNSMLKFIPLLVTAVLALPGPLLAQDTGSVLRIIEAQDQIVRIQAKTRHTTVIVLPASEDILDFVVGDSEYWHLTGAANLAFLKPIAEGVTTNVALVCASGRIYSFLVTEESAGEPHLIVRVEHPQIDDPRISPGVNTPAFVRRSQVTAYQEMAETAMQTVATVQEEAEARVAEAKAQAEGETEAFRSDYPTRLNFPYRLEDKAIEWPFLVEGMWNDGQFTYLRSNAQETPALYEEKDGKPALVAYDLEEDGLYIARHVLGNGWLQIGKEKAKWRFTAPKVAP